MGGNTLRPGRARRGWWARLSTRPLIEEDSLEQALFLPRYLTITILAIGTVAFTGTPIVGGLLIFAVGTAINLLVHRHARRTGHAPLWMPVADLVTCLGFGAAYEGLPLPAALVALAVVTLAATMYGTALSFCLVALGVAGLTGAVLVHDHPDAFAVVLGFGAAGSMIAISVGRLAAAGSRVRRRLDHVVANIDAVLWVFRPSTGEFTFVNRREGSTLGWDVERWGDANFWVDQVHPDDLAGALATFTAAVETGTDGVMQYRFRAADGSWRTMRDRVAVVRDESGRVEALHGMSDDVTEQILIQQRVRRFADIVDRIDQALVVVHVDADGDLVLAAANPASEALLQRPLGQLVGRPVGDVFPTAAGSVMLERLQGVVRSGRSLEVDGIVVARADDQPRVITLRAFPLPDEAAAISLLDVTDAEAAAEALRRQAHYDELTGLPNRRVLDEELQRAVRETPASGERVALLMMDLDQFKEVNDALGHHVGDQLLRGIGDRLSTVIDDALIARLGGDEFAVLLVGMIDDDHALRTAQRVREALSEPFLVDDIRLQSNASIGIALFPDQAVDAAMLIQRADVAMYTAKRSGQGVAFYDPDHDRSSVARLTLSSDLPDAVAAGQLELHFQPFIDLRTGQTVRAEALVRWRHPTWGLLAPEEFVELAGLTGAIQPLTRWVFAEGIRAMASWRDRGHRIGLAVNLSVRNLYDPGLVDHLGDLLERAGLDPFDLVVELTETELMDDARLAREVFEALRSLGVQTAIDDFGLGHSSVLSLRRMPVDALKIHGSLLAALGSDPDETPVVAAVVELAHALGLRVVAEGVESPAQVEELRALGCDLMQGFLLARPVPEQDVESLLDGADGEERFEYSLS